MIDIANDRPTIENIEHADDSDDPSKTKIQKRYQLLRLMHITFSIAFNAVLLRLFFWMVDMQYMPVSGILLYNRSNCKCLVYDNSNSNRGKMLAIFGLYADYYWMGRDVVRRRLPSEAIFSFQDVKGGHFIPITKDNIGGYWNKHKDGAGSMLLVDRFQKALDKHLSYTYKIDVN